MKVYTTVLAKFDAYFNIRRNVIFERAHFNRRSQQEGQTVDKYITELYALAENRNYGDLRDEMIRDHLVVGHQRSLSITTATVGCRTNPREGEDSNPTMRSSR